MNDTNPIDRAAAALGGRQAFIDEFGIGRRTFFYWRQGRRLSAETALKIEAVTHIPRHELRPDLWDAPADAA